VHNKAFLTIADLEAMIGGRVLDIRPLSNNGDPMPEQTSAAPLTIQWVRDRIAEFRASERNALDTANAMSGAAHAMGMVLEEMEKAAAATPASVLMDEVESIIENVDVAGEVTHRRGMTMEEVRSLAEARDARASARVTTGTFNGA